MPHSQHHDLFSVAMIESDISSVSELNHPLAELRRPGAPSFFAHFAKRACPERSRRGGIPRPSRAWDFPSLTTRLFHHIFLVPPSQTPNRNRAIIPRQCSIENCARLQRRTQNSPQTISGGSLIIGRQVHK